MLPTQNIPKSKSNNTILTDSALSKSNASLSTSFTKFDNFKDVQIKLDEYKPVQNVYTDGKSSSNLSSVNSHSLDSLSDFNQTDNSTTNSNNQNTNQIHNFPKNFQSKSQIYSNSSAINSNIPKSNSLSSFQIAENFSSICSNSSCSNQNRLNYYFSKNPYDNLSKPTSLFASSSKTIQNCSLKNDQFLGQCGDFDEEKIDHFNRQIPCNFNSLITHQTNSNLQKQVAILQEKCSSLTNKRIEIQLARANEVRLLLERNLKLQDENLNLKSQYCELSVQFDKVLILCNNVVKTLEEQNKVKQTVDKISNFATNLSRNVDNISNQINRKRKISNYSKNSNFQRKCSFLDEKLNFDENKNILSNNLNSNSAQEAVRQFEQKLFRRNTIDKIYSKSSSDSEAIISGSLSSVDFSFVDNSELPTSDSEESVYYDCYENFSEFCE